jgi:A/G-specific adenine glycosylase
MINLSTRLLNWYDHNKRDLPWRKTKDPYLIWVSEIILQQTKINQGIDYYFNFTNTFQSIDSLAKADIDEVLRIWQGLGYYSRARNMHFTAKFICQNLNSNFPETFNDLKKLKGIGDYTAAAIASFAFNESVPAIDGNVYRVLSRIFGIFQSTQTSSGKKVFFEKAAELIDPKNPASFNQAMMEFGALQCTPKNPDCSACIFKDSCFAYSKNFISDLPIKKQKVKKRDRFFYYIHIIYKDNVFLEKRTDKDIWKLLYQFPLIETEEKSNIEELFNHNLWIDLFQDSNLKILSSTTKKKHILSHQTIFAHFIKVEIDNLNNYIKSNLIKISSENLNKYGIPKLIDSYFKDDNK